MEFRLLAHGEDINDTALNICNIMKNEDSPEPIKRFKIIDNSYSSPSQLDIDEEQIQEEKKVVDDLQNEIEDLDKDMNMMLNYLNMQQASPQAEVELLEDDDHENSKE